MTIRFGERSMGPRARKANSARLAGTLLLLLIATGCLGRSPDPEHFLLGSEVQSQGAGVAPEVALLVGPVRLPAYLDRPQIPRLARRGEIGLDEFGRWLGGFEENFLRALSLELAGRTGSIRVVTHPSKAPFEMDAQVRLHVDDMIVVDGDRLRVRIRWALVRGREDRSPALGIFEEERPLAGRSNLAVVRAYDESIAALAERLVSALPATLD